MTSGLRQSPGAVRGVPHLPLPEQAFGAGLVDWLVEKTKDEKTEGVGRLSAHVINRT